MTMRDIAAKCGVSVATVSNVINGKGGVSEETRKRILRIIEEQQYTPNSAAKHLKIGQTHTIGVIVEDITVFVAPDVVDGITKFCEKNGYRVMLSNMRLYGKYSDTYYYTKDEWFMAQVQQVLRDLSAAQVEGIIYVSAHERTLECLPKEFGIPLVMTYAYSNTEGIPSVVIDDVQGGDLMTEYAISMGHRRIGVITGKEGSCHARDRLLGYQNALFRNQILYNPMLVMRGDWSQDSGARCTDALLEQGATAIFCMNDMMADGVYRRLHQLGVDPGEDVSVMGYDDRNWSGFAYPPLTTVRLPLHEIGYQAGKTMLELLRERRLPKEKPEIRVPCELVVRDSVKNIRQQPN